MRRRAETRRMSRNLLLGLSAISSFVLAGCHHHHQVTASASPAMAPPISAPANVSPRPRPPAAVPAPAAPPSDVSDADLAYVQTHRPILSEEVTASWYGPPYHNRRGANGQIFDQNAMTAAHRTLPMGSLITVTNEKTGQSATMRVTDRGPFVQGRELDLSMASAKATGIYRAGVAPVRIDVYQTPKPIDEGGRWCVQIGAFESEDKAIQLREQLERKYRTAQVIDFTGPTGHWVRIRPEGDNRNEAEMIADRLKPAEGDAYLVRLD
jgi:rare lipoprotein A